MRRARGRRDLSATLRDESGIVRAVWFNQPFRAPLLTEGERYLFSGAVQAYRGVELHNAEFEPAGGDGAHLHTLRLAPRYALTEGVTERWLRARMRDALDGLPPVPDLIADSWRERLDLPDLGTALEEAHFPPTEIAAERARRRLAMEE